MELDDNVGKIMKKIKAGNVEENTIILFLSDNGSLIRYKPGHVKTNPTREVVPLEESMIENGIFSAMHEIGSFQNVLDFNGKNTVLLGGKEDLYEGGHRLPMIWKWPNRIKQNKVNQEAVVSYIDIYATFAEILNHNRTCNEAPDSKSLLSILDGRRNLFPSRAVIHHGIADKGGLNTAIREGQWKYLEAADGPKLFDMDNDIGEENNLFSQKEPTANRLKSKMERMMEQIELRDIKQGYGLFQKC